MIFLSQNLVDHPMIVFTIIADGKVERVRGMLPISRSVQTVVAVGTYVSGQQTLMYIWRANNT